MRYRASSDHSGTGIFSMRFTRRALLGLSPLLAVCRWAPPMPNAAPSSPTPEMDSRKRHVKRPSRQTVSRSLRLTLGLSPLPPTLQQQAVRWMDLLREQLPPRWTLELVEPEQASIRLRVTSRYPTGPVVGVRYLVPVTSNKNFVSSLDASSLDALLAARIRDWRDLGHPEPLPVVRISVQENGKALDQPDLTVTNASDLSAQVPGGAFALVEPWALYPYLRVLHFEGRDPLRFDQNDYPRLLTEWLTLEGAVDLLPPETLQPLFATRPVFTTLTFAGDVILGRTVHRIMAARGDWASPFRSIASELSWADLTIVNLECALTRRFQPPADPYTLRFMSFPEAIAGLTLAGIDAVSLANNHSMDFGYAAVQDTRQVCEEVGITTFGVGDNLAAAVLPAVFQIGSSRIALLGFDGVSTDWYGARENTPGTAPLRADIVEDAVRIASQQADIVIPFYHWGVEYTLVPTAQQREIARRAIDAGATLVVGSHPHWVQGVEWHRDRPIFYSLGNFVFDQERSLETKQGLILHLWLSGAELVRYELVPVLIEDYHRPRLARGEEAQAILQRVRESSRLLSEG
jgi:poly-gamma-glutamate capsule biosynthesis protein CapA/YwtB (metallophosphatase superfamily)